MAMNLFVIAAPGLEEIVAKEVRALPGATAVRTVPGGVELRGDAAVLYAANLKLRCATRVLLRLGSFTARSFGALKAGVASLRWKELAAGAARITVRATAHRSRLYHTGAIAERVLEALAELGVHRGEADAELSLFLRAEDDVFTVSIDTSGELLHRRGFRTEAGEAPLRETLAAALLEIAGYSGAAAGPLCDPTCGSGTLVIEAALIASQRAPGLLRGFAFQRWPSYREELYRALFREAAAAERGPPRGLLLGSDVSEAAVALARRNAERAEVAEHVRFEVRDVRSPHLQLPDGPPGLVLCNPPYGKRLFDRQLVGLYRAVGRYARSRAGWRLGVLCPEQALGRAAFRRCDVYPLENGGLRVFFCLSQPLPQVPQRAYVEEKEREGL